MLIVKLRSSKIIFLIKKIIRSQNSEKRPLATKIIGNEQISGCILQPHYFVIIDR